MSSSITLSFHRLIRLELHNLHSLLLLAPRLTCHLGKVGSQNTSCFIYTGLWFFACLSSLWDSSFKKYLFVVWWLCSRCLICLMVPRHSIMISKEETMPLSFSVSIVLQLPDFRRTASCFTCVLRRCQLNYCKAYSWKIAFHSMCFINNF